jgi:hypothetical protein
MASVVLVEYTWQVRVHLEGAGGPCAKEKELSAGACLGLINLKCIYWCVHVCAHDTSQPALGWRQIRAQSTCADAPVAAIH